MSWLSCMQNKIIDHNNSEGKHCADAIETENIGVAVKCMVLFKNLTLIFTVLLLISCSGNQKKGQGSKREFCYQGVCIPDSDDPNHPKFHLNVPVLDIDSMTHVESDETYTWLVPKPCGDVYKSGWYSIGPDKSVGARVESSIQNNPECGIKATSYYRNHWTVTCWRTTDWGPTYTDYECHNWNTIWGDSWAFYFTALTEGI